MRLAGILTASIATIAACNSGSGLEFSPSNSAGAPTEVGAGGSGTAGPGAGGLQSGGTGGVSGSDQSGQGGLGAGGQNGGAGTGISAGGGGGVDGAASSGSTGATSSNGGSSASGDGGVDGAGGTTTYACPPGQKRACVLTVGSPCTSGVETCDGNGWSACLARAPIDEWCNGVDDDCDGQVDEALTSCAVASSEVCDGVDNDQDGAVDETASDWSSPTSVASTTGTDGQSALAVDWMGGAHLAYYDSVNKDLYDAYRAPTGEWSTPEPIDQDGSVGTAVSIAVALNGGVHVAYRNASTNRVKYAYRNSRGQWQAPETIDVNVNAGDYTAMAVDPTGVVHVAYRDIANTALRYAKRTKSGVSGVWSDEPVDNGGNVGRAPAIAVEATGSVHVTYFDSTAKALRYSSRTAGTSGTWLPATTVDDTDNAGRHSSLVADSAGGLHVTYYRSAAPSKDLRYAYKAPGGAWALDPNPIDYTSSDYGNFSSLSLDAHGQLHVLFRDDQNQQLAYATTTGGAWQPGSVVDSSNNVGEFASLAVSEGNLLASYYDAVNGQLKTVNRCLGHSSPQAEHLSFEFIPGQSDVDIGWTGNTHDFPMVTGAIHTMKVVSCENATPPRGNCELEGPATNIQGANLRRCTSTPRQPCLTDAHCEWGTCGSYFGAPVPTYAGGIPACIVSHIDGPTSGTFNMETGEGTMDTFKLSSAVHLGDSVPFPCPVCEGDATPMNRNPNEGGHCIGGANDGDPCDAGGYSDLFGWTSLDCPPPGGSNLVGTGLKLSLGPLTTDGLSWTPTAGGPKCSGDGFQSLGCYCGDYGQTSPDACDRLPSGATACGTVSDSVCTALRCQNTPDKQCYENQNCPGDTCILSPTTVASSLFCAGGHGVSCSTDDDCADVIPGDTCVDAPQPCFEPTLNAEGSASPMVGGAGQIRLGSLSCADATSNGPVNLTVGLPGPVRVQATMNVRHFLP